MQVIKSETIEKAVYELCVIANTQYDVFLYEKIYKKYIETKDSNYKHKLLNILKNIQLANETKRPLCQDTGQVIVFVKIGQNVCIEGADLNNAINSGVECAYKLNFYRKSVVNNAFFDRTNTQTNTPAIIYTEIVSGDNVELSVLVKGAGSENYSVTKMFKPNEDKSEIFGFIKTSILNAGEKSCPPFVLGIGAGGTLDYAALLSKKAFFKNDNSDAEKEFIRELSDYLKNYQDMLLDIKIMTAQTHIACLPVALTINCHSTRHASCIIQGENVAYNTNILPSCELIKCEGDLKEIMTTEFDVLRNLNPGESVLLSGEIYTARDAAHKRIQNFYEKNGIMPFDIKDKIIFYAGPCPAAEGEVIGPIGPTTSARMDKYCELLYSQGLLATLGKGERSTLAKEAIKKYNGKYFTTQGGIACLLERCVKSCEIITFEDLGPEAVRKLYVEKLPVKVEI